MEEKDKTHELETRYLSELANKELSCASAQRESSRLENENANLLAENSKLKRRAEHLEKEVHELTLKSNTESQLHPQVVPKEIQTLQEKVLKLREQVLKIFWLFYAHMLFKESRTKAEIKRSFSANSQALP